MNMQARENSKKPRIEASKFLEDKNNLGSSMKSSFTNTKLKKNSLSSNPELLKNKSSFRFNETSFMNTDEHQSMINTTRGEFRIHQSRFKHKADYDKTQPYAMNNSKKIQLKYSQMPLSPIMQEQSPETRNSIQLSSKSNKNQVNQFNQFSPLG